MVQRGRRARENSAYTEVRYKSLQLYCQRKSAGEGNEMPVPARDTSVAKQNARRCIYGCLELLTLKLNGAFVVITQ